MKGQQTILITGIAGFIGYHLAKKLIKTDHNLIGIDNMNSYYDPKLKEARINDILKSHKNTSKNLVFKKCDLHDNNSIENLFLEYRPKIVINMAAQAGVRYSIENPNSYVSSNLVGFCNLIECCRKYEVKNFIYASSSSVYGGNTKLPFFEKDEVNHPVSLYAATKKANELIAHSYSHLYQIPTTGLRLFTVYGPWGRPDMAPMIFTKSILEKIPIKIFNNGNMTRDFTYVDDVVEIIKQLVEKPASSNSNFNIKKPDPSTSWAPYKIFNIGNNKSVKLLDFIKSLEEELDIEAIKEFVPMQKGDVKDTFADTQAIEYWTGHRPNTSLKKGIKIFVKWYKEFYKKIM